MKRANAAQRRQRAMPASEIVCHEEFRLDAPLAGVARARKMNGACVAISG
jgi:hypothetical protein